MNPEAKKTAKARRPARRATSSAWQPEPADTSAVAIPPEIAGLTELLARNTHENWAAQRLAQGWSWGPARDDAKRQHPCLVAYEELPDAEKEFDRRTALETVRLILSLGYRIVTPTEEAPPGSGAGRRPAASTSPSRPGCARRTRS